MTKIVRVLILSLYLLFIQAIKLVIHLSELKKMLLVVHLVISSVNSAIRNCFES